MNINKLENVCKWLQSQDRNGDYLDMVAEYHDDELELETIHDVCTNVLTDWKEDLNTASHLTDDDKHYMNQIEAHLNHLQG